MQPVSHGYPVVLLLELVAYIGRVGNNQIPPVFREDRFTGEGVCVLNLAAWKVFGALLRYRPVYLHAQKPCAWSGPAPGSTQKVADSGHRIDS